MRRPHGWDAAYREAALAAGVGELTIEHALRTCGSCRYYKNMWMPEPLMMGHCSKDDHYCNTERTMDMKNTCGPQGRWWEPR